MSKQTSSSGLVMWLSIALIVVLLDQTAKVVILGSMHYGQSHYVWPCFNIVRAHNTGAAFSFLARASGWQRWMFTALGLGAAAFITWLLSRHAHQRLFAWALSLILGGAVGNVIDRLIHGYVVDFLQFHWRWLAPLFPGGYFPAFNIADSAITVGAGLLILDELLRVRHS
jgi:signal peptidase II